MKLSTQCYLLIYCFFLLSACSNLDSAREKLQADFKNRVLPTETFTISTKEDQVVESSKGSVLIIPKGAFFDENGEIWEGDAEISLVEIQTPTELLEAHISSASKEGMMSTLGILQLQAQANGQKLTINPENAPYIELAVDGAGKDLKVYKGVEGKYGAIKWTKPEAAPRFLIPQDLNSLDFYPNGFEQMVEASMPYKSHQVATKALKDSLYYSLHDFFEVVDDRESDDVIKSPFILDGELDSMATFNCSGIDPAIIQTIKHDKFANTFLATREFAARLKGLFQTCDNENLNLYINNLDKNLWEVDEMIANRMGKGHELYKTFKGFAAEKLTTVKDGVKYVDKLKAFYGKKLKANQKALEKKAKAYRKANEKKDQEALKKRTEYRKLLQKRMDYRLKRHGIIIKDDGLYSLCEVLKKLDTFELDVHVPNAKDFDRVHVYLIDPVENCLFSLLPDDEGVYNQGYDDDWLLVMWKHQLAHITVVAYKGEQKFMNEQMFQLAAVNHIEINIETSDKGAIKKLMEKFDKKRKRFNKIEVDLEYQRYFEADRKRIEKLIEEENFMRSLAVKAFPCCFEKALVNGANLFKANCASCHAVHEQVVGPALKDILKRRSMAWAVKFTKNAEKLIASGDSLAVQVYKP